MSYTVLARKYRSQTFDDLIGQDAIATTLKNAILSGRIHHGYLFTGTRGVGKTSTARVLAKSLNCLSADGPTPSPCGTCESCQRTAEGEDLDVLEIDAASNTGVDNIRDLRGNAAYRPARSRYKVYIIDEVHMLSTAAFNALLKTLEEPPDHVKFILATTEIQKVPATIVSRCQRFDFRSIPIKEIVGHLQTILAAEKIKSDEDVIRRVARLANGSMRDALSLLDQLLSFDAERLSIDTLNDVLPPAYDEVITSMMDRITEDDAGGALERVEEAMSRGQTVDRFCELLVEHLRTLMILRICGPESDLLDLPAGVRDPLVAQAGHFDAATYVHMISLAEETRRNVKFSNASRALLDAAVVRLALSAKFSDLDELIAELNYSTAAKTVGPGESRAARVGAMSNPSTAVERTKTASTGASVTRKAPSQVSRATSHGAARSAGASSPARPSPPSSQVTSADEAGVRRDPSVRKAMDLFDGKLVRVQRVDSVMLDTELAEVDADAQPTDDADVANGGD